MLAALACTLVAVFVAGSVEAGGLYVNEFSTSAQANAGAGRGAWAVDASAALSNPATMTQLDDHAFSTGFSAAFGRIEFDATSGGGNGGNQAGVAPIASMNYVHRISDRFRFGFTFFSLSGSILDPQDDWAGRFEVTDLSLLTISVSPTIAVRLTDWLSIGAGPVVTYGVLNWDLRADVPIVGERSIELHKLNDWQAAGRVGLLFHPSDDFALSAYYNSKTDFRLDGKIKIPAGLAASLNAKLPLAQFVELGAHWQATERLALLATLNWEDWSDADNLTVTLGSRTIGATTGFRDTFKFGVGVNLLVRSGWLLQTGFMYDTSALKDSDRTTALPVDRQIRASIGVRHPLNPGLTLGLSFVYANLGRGKVNQASVSGDYRHNDLFFFGISFDYSKLWWSGKLSL